MSRGFYLQVQTPPEKTEIIFPDDIQVVRAGFFFSPLVFRMTFSLLYSLVASDETQYIPRDDERAGPDKFAHQRCYRGNHHTNEHVRETKNIDDQT